MMRVQYEKRIEMHKELQPIFNEFNESRLAVGLLKKPGGFNSVRKISSAIVKLILANYEKVMEIISKEPKIIAELREPFFGCLYNKGQIVTPSGALARMVAVLNDKNTSLDKIMQLHCIFCYRIYPSLTTKKENTVPFSGEPRIAKHAEPTYSLGIVNHPIFTNILGKHNKLHIRAIDKYRPNYNCSFFKIAKEQAIPVVCGPSGHTKSLLLGAKLYGELASSELEEYVVACFAFLTAGGNHSFHEVMSGAKLFGVDFPLPEHVANRI